jgi:dephospho-CoA kinase
VVGNIGSGKSAFFQALLSEMDYPINTSTETKYSSKKSSFVEENPNSQLLRSFIGT